MFERILLASDGSESGAIAAVLELAGALGPGAVVEVLHVKEFEYETPDGRTVPAPSCARASELATATVAELCDRGIQARCEIRQSVYDDLAEDILAEARSTGADLIVMGCHCRSSFSAWVMGSVAHKVIKGAACPVLVAAERRPAHEPALEHAAGLSATRAGRA